ncbi:MAG TPA: peptide-methionine (S)-S-oxide reductase MsrA [Ignavibacteria bacterium]|nr:peptide-methionine (S)-S-oxide reductase [Bacteroidota bacterium]HRI85765.1 peptide-methionine (S)-S-oxide reductase MsrA [Ignavibacteria bacterium]HRK00255.1 peptide-methionine (S)-S-oxide reductase MsrA [Ignavibacteria bacterium]
MKKSVLIISLFIIAGLGYNFLSSSEKENTSNTNTLKQINYKKGASEKLEQATLAGGCFWCIETIFRDLKGVESVISGYSGGSTKNPTYEEVCTGKTGHAEVVQISFDPEVIGFDKLLEIFFHIHDPTTLNRQGADAGTQYRSAIFYHSENQKDISEEVIKKFNESKLWDDPIVTEVSGLDVFYPAEDYHQDYYNNNKDKSYCSLVIAPKVRKFYKDYKDLIKDNTGK